MLINMTKLAWMYGIGVLVIDEIQHLLNAKNDMDEMLNFFVTLSNTVGIPTVLIGTSKAQQIFNGNFRQARRAASEGSIIWDRMQKDSEEWTFFLESIWEFQGLKKIVQLTDKIKDVFYEECQGITSVAVNLFLLAQERALQEGDEEITIKILRDTAQIDLKMIQPMIRALRNNNLSEIMKYEDISINLDEIESNYKRNIELSGLIEDSFKERKKTIELNRKSTIENLVMDLSDMDIFDNLTIPDMEKICRDIVEKGNVNEEYSVLKKSSIKKALIENEKIILKNNKVRSDKEGGLLTIFNISKDRKQHTYDILKQHGFIKDPMEEFLNLG